MNTTIWGELSSKYCVFWFSPEGRDEDNQGKWSRFPVSTAHRKHLESFSNNPKQYDLIGLRCNLSVGMVKNSPGESMGGKVWESLIHTASSAGALSCLATSSLHCWTPGGMGSIRNDCPSLLHQHQKQPWCEPTRYEAYLCIWALVVFTCC